MKDAKNDHSMKHDTVSQNEGGKRPTQDQEENACIGSDKNAAVKGTNAAGYVAKAKKEEIEEEDDGVVYKFNIPTIRSAIHRVRYSDTKASKGKHNDKQGKNGKKKQAAHKIADARTQFQLPAAVRKESLLKFDTTTHDIRQAVTSLLKSADASLFGIVGEDHHEIGCHQAPVEAHNTELERLHIPPLSLSRKSHGGKVEMAQQSLSDHIVSNDQFLNVFDKLVTEVVLPDLRRRVLEGGYFKNQRVDQGDDTPMTFYYQRPPTMRLQPGPSRARVKPHADCEYGHQDGELNYWLPLTNHELTQTCLWCETEPGSNDMHPMYSKYGEINSFFGSYCKHFVPPNASKYTRVSIDFRVGLKEFGFEPDWQMLGTTHDLTRREHTL
jgi:hypothetical protein